MKPFNFGNTLQNYKQVPQNNEQKVMQQCKGVGDYIVFLTQVLGAGQYGTVYLCQHLSTKGLFACKMVRIGNTTQESLQELEVAKQIKGEFICQLVYAALSNSNLYLITEYCPDGTLKKFVQDMNPFSIDRIMMVFYQIVKGYNESMYQKKCIHRDLKLDNILMKEGKPKICDFGFGKFLDNVTVPIEQTSKCTPVFGSPQIMNEPDRIYSYKADIYSLGVILYMMTNNLQHPNNVKDSYGLYQFLNQSKTSGIRNILQFQNANLNQNIKNLIYDMMEYQENQRISIDDLQKRCEEVCQHLRYNTQVFGVQQQQQQQQNYKYNFSQQFQQNRTFNN